MDLLEPLNPGDNLQESANVFEDSRRARANGIGKAAWILEDALAENLVENYPRDQEARRLFFQSAQASKRYNQCIMLMFLLSMFETPSWCTPKTNQAGFWKYKADLCIESLDAKFGGGEEPEFPQADGTAAEKKAREDALDYMFSGVPYIPPGWGLVIEAILLSFMWRKLSLDKKLQTQHFDKLSQEGEEKVNYFNMKVLKVCQAMVLIESVDCAVFFFLRNEFRVIWMTRFVFMICIPSVGSLLIAIRGIIVEFAAIAAFYVIGMLLFAWIATMLLQGMGKDDKTPYTYVFQEKPWPNRNLPGLTDGETFEAIFTGEDEWMGHKVNWDDYSVNYGFQNIMQAVLSMFVAGATDDFYERFRNTYSRKRSYGLLWLAFLVIVKALLLSLVLDTLVDSYTKHNEEQEERGIKGKAKGMMQAFKELTNTCSPQTKKECIGLNGRIIKEKDFIDFALEFGKSPYNMSLSKEQAECLFKAVARRQGCSKDCDQGGERGLLLRGFIESCGLMRFNIWFTIKDSPVKEQFPSIWNTWWFQKLYDWTQEPKDGESALNRFMNTVLFCNLFLVALEVGFEIQKEGGEEEEKNLGVPSLELMFSFIYLLEVGIKLCVWSWEEYVSLWTNLFDFWATLLLLGSSIAGEFDDSLPGGDSKDGGGSTSGAGSIKKVMGVLRLLRLVRVIKQLKQYPAVQFMLGTIVKLIAQAKNILALLLIVVYFFTALSVQLFGGLLWKGREKVMETEWAEEKYWVLNFNDFLNSFGCWVVLLLTEYKHGFTQAIGAVGPPGTKLIFFIFYLFSVAIIFELVKAYTIEVFVDLHRENAMEKAEFKTKKAERNKEREKHNITLEDSKKVKKTGISGMLAGMCEGEDDEKQLKQEIGSLEHEVNKVDASGKDLEDETKEMLEKQIASIKEMQQDKQDPLEELKEEFEEQQGKRLHTAVESETKEMKEILKEMVGIDSVGDIFVLKTGEKVRIVDFDVHAEMKKTHEDGEEDGEEEEEEPIFTWLVQSLDGGKPYELSPDEFKHPPGEHEKEEH